MLRKLGLTVAATALAVGMAASPAMAKKFMNIGYATSDAHPYGTFMNTFAERFTNLTGKNKGLDPWPLTLIADDGKVLSTNISVVGNTEDCSSQSDRPAPSLKPALPKEGALNVCAPLDPVTLIGSGANQVTEATLLGVTSLRVKHASKETVLISFPPLPGFAKPEDTPAKTELRFIAGGKEHSLEVPLRCQK